MRFAWRLGFALILLSVFAIGSSGCEEDIIGDPGGPFYIGTLEASPNPVKAGRISTITLEFQGTGLNTTGCWKASITSAAGGFLDLTSGSASSGNPITIHFQTKRPTTAHLLVTATTEQHAGGVCGDSVEISKTLDISVIP